MEPKDIIIIGAVGLVGVAVVSSFMNQGKGKTTSEISSKSSIKDYSNLEGIVKDLIDRSRRLLNELLAGLKKSVIENTKQLMSNLIKSPIVEELLNIVSEAVDSLGLDIAGSIALALIGIPNIDLNLKLYMPLLRVLIVKSKTPIATRLLNKEKVEPRLRRFRVPSKSDVVISKYLNSEENKTWHESAQTIQEIVDCGKSILEEDNEHIYLEIENYFAGSFEDSLAKLRI